MWSWSGGCCIEHRIQGYFIKLNGPVNELWQRKQEDVRCSALTVEYFLQKAWCIIDSCWTGQHKSYKIRYQTQTAQKMRFVQPYSGINPRMWKWFGMRLECVECEFNTFSMVWSVDKTIPEQNSLFAVALRRTNHTNSKIKTTLF